MFQTGDFSPPPSQKKHISGSIFFALFAVVGMIGLVGFAATNVIKGPVSTMQLVTKRTIAEENIIASGKLAVMNTLALPNSGDCDGDGLLEPVGWSTSGTGVAPVGGGFLPAGLGVGLRDPWGTSYGYCVWDHGSAIRTGACPSDNRLRGNAAGTGILVAVISAGPDKKFQTSCADAPAFLQRVASSDDVINSYTYAEAQTASGGLWNLKGGDNTVAQIGKNLEVKNSGGNVTFALDSQTGAGTFESVTTGAISKKNTTPIAMESGLRLANELNVADAACVPAQAGMLRYHSTSGVQVCNGTAFAAVGGGGGAGGYNYKGLFEGKISAGGFFSCGLRSDGVAYCWGNNNNGQLGDGTNVNKSVPTAVSGGHKFVRISVGYQHSCGLRSDGVAYCWGYNGSGQLGNGTSTLSYIPQEVSGGHKFVELSLSSDHTCGLRSDGVAYCWGANGSGPLGDGTTTPRRVPTMVSGGHKFVQISAGGNHSCGLLNDGTALCWGSNYYGPIGDGTNVNKSVPTAVSGDHKFVQISLGGNHSCGIRSDGTAYCWGYNYYGPIGDGTNVNKSVPTAVSGDHKFVQISLGDAHTCGLRSDGALYCWGLNTSGQLGDETNVNKSVPTAVNGSVSYAQIEVGSGHTCGLRGDGAAYCWGLNTSGQLGDGTSTARATPTHVVGFSMVDFQKNTFQFGDNNPVCDAASIATVRYKGAMLEMCDGAEFKPLGAPPNQYNYGGLFEGKIAAGEAHSCVLRLDGKVWCWGYNLYGQLGDGTTTQRTTPVLVPGPHKFVQIVTGKNHTCGLRADGAAWCWGENAGRLGNGGTATSTNPVAVLGGHKFTKIVAGAYNTCGLRTDGTVYCWGTNTSGSLGDGTMTQRTQPTLISGVVDKVITIAATYQGACAITTTGKTYCWGSNPGNGTSNSASPVEVSGNYQFIQISGGGSQTCGILSDGRAYCWGINSSGQLGNGTTNASYVPVAVAGGHKFTKITAGENHTCGIRSDAGLYCWGYGYYYQTGIGTSSQQVTPQAVLAGMEYVEISAGYNHNCAIKSNGMVLCWGRNTNYQLNDTTTTNRWFPVNASGFSINNTQGISFQFANDSPSCGSGTAGTVRYNGGTTWEYCDGTAWKQFAPGGGGGSSALWLGVETAFNGTCALRDNGAAYCWGAASDGRIGDGMGTIQENIPKPVSGGYKFVQLNYRQHFACGLTAAGNAYCWGYEKGTTPTAYGAPHLFKQLAVGDQGYICGLKADGDVYCWSSGTPTPTLLGGGHKFVKISVGSNDRWACGIRSDGAPYCWGNNMNGTLGDGNIGLAYNSPVPVAVLGGHKFKEISAGWSSACGLTTGGDAYCWANNYYGQSGDGSTTNSYSPIAVAGGHKFSKIYTGYQHVCGLRTDGNLYCWGRNDTGQLGIGNSTDSSVPVAVLGGHKFLTANAGGGHTCGVRTDGTLYCWGGNSFSRLGLGPTGSAKNVPTKVLDPP